MYPMLKLKDHPSPPTDSAVPLSTFPTWVHEFLIGYWMALAFPPSQGRE
jgi:hypothetical protein